MEIKKSDEQVVIDYLRSAYSDERLAMLLAHAEDGKLSYNSCCCFVGVATAEHPIQAGWCDSSPQPHGRTYSSVPGGEEVSDAYNRFASIFNSVDHDEQRRVKLIPLIHAEIKRRDELKSESQVTEPEFSFVK